MLLLGIAVLTALLVPSYQQNGPRNTSPSFVEDLSSILVDEGVFENTTAMTILGRISCSDPDVGDRIGYFVANSKSVTVNPTTGDVILISSLDREQTANSVNSNEKPNSVTFECVDYDENGVQKSTERTKVDLVITVKDNNDMVPRFSTDSIEGFTFIIGEDAPVGTVLNGIISVVDEDRGSNARLSSLNFFCDGVDKEPCEVFSLNDTEVDEGVYRATVVLQQNLDYETRVDYRAKIRAVDGVNTPIHNTASVGVRILIGDRQDTNPVFTNKNFNFNLREGVQAGGQINFALSARDGDLGDIRRAISMEILEHTSGVNLFRPGVTKLTNPATGEYSAVLFARTDIDREIPEVTYGYTFTAKATELDSNGDKTNATTTAVFSVTIDDANDNTPTFSNDTYHVTIKEMEQINGTVQIPNLRMQVTDLDEPTNAQYRMEIVSQTFNGAFGFAPNIVMSGTQYFYLTVNNFQYMDYEVPAYRSQVVTVRVVEIRNGVPGTLSSSATVSVTLTDINDNFPSFERDTYESSIVENAARTTTVLTVKATDPDSGKNGEIEYSIVERIKTLFSIDANTGVISLVGQLDFETQSEYSFLVFATDKATIPKTSQALVRVLVTDYNDIGPQFTLPRYIAAVTESSTQFESPVKVEAIDPADPDAPITYRIVSGNTPTNSFVLDPNSGELSLKETLNYDLTPNGDGIFSLVIEASDNGVPPQTAQSRITVTVTDENNNSPIFNPSIYSKTLSETVNPGTFVVQVNATDADFGSNGDISYRIGTGSRDSFVVDTDGKVFVSSYPNFDYDVFKSLSVQLIAVDGGSPQRSATATMLITVTDANNKHPRFVQPLYNTIIDEATPKGTSVLQVSAIDPDSVNRLQYTIVTSSIAAINKAGAQLQSTYPYDYTKIFDIDRTTGVISVSPNGPAFDRDYVVEMAFEVTVEDLASATGPQNDIARVTLTIAGKPETALFFNLPWTKDNPTYDLPILESSPVGTEIITLQARDPTEGERVVQEYEELPNTDVGDYFRIVSKTDFRGVVTPGIVVLNSPLDYDLGDIEHSVVIRAIQPATPTSNYGRRTVTATVIIRVQDFNDNAPEFTRNTYEFAVRESVPLNYQVGVITARDIDSSSFGPIQFTLGGGQDRNDFNLYQPDGNQRSAVLLVNRELDFERRSSYSIDVIATDNILGQGSAIRQTSNAVVNIQIIDENDNTPTFPVLDEKRTFSVPETAPLQTRLGQIIASDGDFGLNGKISYTLVEDASSQLGGTPLQLFRITESSGVLVTKSSLRGMSGSFAMRVVATDAGTPPRSSSIAVIIKVQGAEDNDGSPRWIGNNYIVYVKEFEYTKSEPERKLNIEVKALSRTRNVSIIYSLIPFSSDYKSFRINSTTGDIFITTSLDREVQATYTLVLEAMDSADRDKISQRTLTVIVTDDDDNQPSFLQSNYSACPDDFSTELSALDGTPAGTIVAEALACDPDGPGNNQLYYSLFTSGFGCESNNNDAFLVHLNGSIENIRTLDYEEQEEYKLCVLVHSSPTVSGSGRVVDSDTVAHITISIVDINDNGPVFPASTYTAVLETIPSEDIVIQVLAHDPDGPLNSRTIYDISTIIYHPPNDRQPYSVKGAFTINPLNGVITTTLPSYEDFAQGYFEIQVLAFDVQNQLFNDSAVVTVVVIQKSQVLRVVLDKTPAEGLAMAEDLQRALNDVGQPNTEFFFESVSEHRTGPNIVDSQTDICFVIVEKKKAYFINPGVGLLDTPEYRTILSNVGTIDRGRCYSMLSSEDKVKWRDLWWVLVVIAIFLFICSIILLATLIILYDRYKNFMQSERTYLVPQ